MKRTLFLAFTAFVGLFGVSHADTIDPAENADLTPVFVYSAPAIPVGSLIAHISFNETDGTVAHDSSSNGNDALVSEDTVWAPGMNSDASGIGSGAISFDGTNDRALVPNDIIGIGSVTACVSYNANSLPSGAVLISNSQFAISLNQNGALTVTNDGSHFVTSSSSIIPGTWNTVCVARDASGQTTLNINGQLSAQGDAGSPVAGSSVGIGGHPWYDGHGWDGLISDVRIYSGIVNVQ